MTVSITRRAALAGMAALPFVPAAARAETVGSITRFDPALDAVLGVNTPIEVLATGYRWAEGPVWVKKGGYLLFSDVPANIAYRWKQGEGVSPFLNPSGLAGPIPAGIREAGSNGLGVDERGRLIVADSGTRVIAAVDLATKRRTILADRYEGKRFNSCNDVAFGRAGAIYFTDPPYGLAEGDSSPLKELPFNGVFLRSGDGKVHAIDKTLSRPNGIGLCPKKTTLYVSMSDETRPHILVYPLGADGLPRAAATIFHDFSEPLARKLPGLPDGLKVDKAGRLFASGPGGIYVLSPEGKALGLIATGKAAANCAFGEDGRSLFITSSDMLVRVRLKSPGW
ncbi:SMP-30/gluconolactonase/LRE family protein [Sphingomonas psychrotolerans]|uniref:SMP-30/gluconolactonase/LRE family protein n=1 Tax=Sphingomonas psychrotolerans TaxID=1327635 RepID=A0ABU3N5P1_9SPHN|nr:SMP-30/gluconolactonase/LRE family protein [Sphingomonas psychrotolerans]MDT8759853.1 SMP-30/gluconolactonase/LRE family protein [Sphingomonas psychrotolerans]